MKKELDLECVMWVKRCVKLCTKTGFDRFHRLLPRLYRRQGASEIGLDAQHQAVFGFVGSGQLVSEFTEVESVVGTRTDRNCLPRSMSAAAVA